MESLLKDRVTANEHRNIIPYYLLAAHALTRCYNTACYFRVGKVTIGKHLNHVNTEFTLPLSLLRGPECQNRGCTKTVHHFCCSLRQLVRRSNNHIIFKTNGLVILSTQITLMWSKTVFLASHLKIWKQATETYPLEMNAATVYGRMMTSQSLLFLSCCLKCQTCSSRDATISKVFLWKRVSMWNLKVRL